MSSHNEFPAEMYDIINVADTLQPWRREAKCLGSLESNFYSHAERLQEAAKAICKQCDVQAECLNYAISRPEIFGVWGGTTAAERRIIIRNRGSTKQSA